MKRNTGSKKVLRAIALALATVVTVTSFPVTTFAEDQEEQTIVVENLIPSDKAADEANDAVDGAKSQESSVSSESNPITIELNNESTNTKDAFNEKFDVNITDKGAKESHDAYNSKNNISGGNDVGGYLEEVDSLVKATKDALLTIQNNGYGDAESTASTTAGTIDGNIKANYIADLEVVQGDDGKARTVDTVDLAGAVYDDENKQLLYVLPVDENGIPAFDENGNILVYVPETRDGVTIYNVMKLVYKNGFDSTLSDTKNDIDTAGQNIDTANHSTNETEARGAAAEVGPSLEKVGGEKGDFAKIKAAAQKAEDALIQADSDLSQAWSDFNGAVSTAQKAQENALNGAVKDTAAASAIADQTKARVDSIKEAAQKAFDNRSTKEMELIRTLYESYEGARKDSSEASAAYNSCEEPEDSETKKALKDKKDKAGANVWYVGGELCKALARYNIYEEARNQGQLVTNFQISGGIDGDDKLSKELLAYIKTVGDDFEIQETNGEKQWVRTSSDYTFPDTENAKKGDINYGYKWKSLWGKTADGKDYELKTTHGWITSPTQTIDGKAVTEPNNVVVVRYGLLDEDGNTVLEADGTPKVVERYFNYKIEGGQVIFFERTIEAQDIEGTAHAETPEISDFYIGGDTDKTAFSSIESNYTADQIKEIKDENGKVTSKVVPSSEARNTTDKTYYQNTNETAASGTTYSYEELPEAERIEYELDENTLVKIDTPVAVNTVNKEKKDASRQKMIDDVTALLGNETYLKDGELSPEYEISIVYDTILQHNELTIDNYNNKPSNFWEWVESIPASLDDWAADKLDTAKYSIVVNQVMKKDPGYVVKEYKNVIQTDTSEDTDSKKASPHFTTKKTILGTIPTGFEGGKTKAQKELNNWIEDLKNNNYVYDEEKGTCTKTLSDGTIETYSFEMKDLGLFGDSNLKAWCDFLHISLDEEVHVWNVVATITKEKTSNLGKQLVSETHYGRTEFNKVITQEYVAAATDNLQTIVWESDDAARTNHGEQKATVAKEYKDFYDAFQKIVKTQSAVNTAATEVDDLETEINTLKTNGLTPANSSVLENLTKQLGLAKIAHKVALQYRDSLWSKFAPLTDGVIDLSRFDPVIDDDDDDDDDDDSGVTPGAGTFVLPGAGASTLASFDLSGMTFDDGRGVAGARTGRRSVASTNSGSGVLGARTEGENKEPVVVNDTKNKDSKGSTEKDNKKLEKIENNQIPLADAPFAEAFGLNWLWMLLAGAVGVGAYSYDRHRKKAAANEEMKKYKK